MKLGILTSGHLGFVILKQISDFYNIELIFTDKNSAEVINYANKNEIALYIGNPRNNNCQPFIENKEIDILISINYLFIIEKDLINFPRLLTFNIHGSLLPKYRGRTPHVWAIINNEKETGITAHLIDSECDTGDIIKQIRIPIELNETGADILNKFQENYFNLIDSILKEIKQNNTIKTTKQDHSKASYFSKRTPKDGEINWEWQKERIYNWIRAQASPYPGAFTHINNQKLTIDEVKYSDHHFTDSIPNGFIISNEPFIVKTPNGAIEICSIRENINIIKGSTLS